MNRIVKVLVVALVAMLFMALDTFAQTNTASGIYTSVTDGFTDVFDALVALGVGVLVVSVGFALVKSMVPHRARVK